MKKKKLERRIKVLRLIRRWMGMDGIVQMSTYVQASKKISVEMDNMGYNQEQLEYELIHSLAVELVQSGLIQLDKGTEGDDHIKHFQTWYVNIKAMI